jgi:hypothetical protein
MITPLARPRLASAKAAYTVRRVDLSRELVLQSGPDVEPNAGDLILAEVTRIGQHKGLELASSRKATLYCGDEVLVAYGGRYAPDQFEAEVPHDLSECQLVAAGGLAARVTAQHLKMGQATDLRPIGLLGRVEGGICNVRDGAIAPLHTGTGVPTTIVVVGTSMNAGKTTTVAAIAHGLTAAGLRVGAAKVTGTGAGGDPNLFADAGAAEVLDFIDAGYASTYRVPVDALADAFVLLHGELAGRDVDAIVIEIADGILQPETKALLEHHTVTDRITGMVFAAGDAMGAVAGVATLRGMGLPVLAASGLLTASPLATREAQSILDVPVYSPDDLGDATIARTLAERAGMRQANDIQEGGSPRVDPPAAMETQGRNRQVPVAAA